jgi:molecular chaperone DnaK (HSP70)
MVNGLNNIKINEKQYNPTQLSTIVLLELKKVKKKILIINKKIAENYLEKKIDKLVISVPSKKKNN